MRNKAGLAPRFNNIIARDTFTDSDSTGLGSHSLNQLRLASGWSVNAGAVEISSNLAAVTTATAIATLDAGTPDVEVLGVTHSISGGKFSLTARFSDTSNYWRAELDTADTFKLIKVVSGTPTTVDSAAMTVDAAVNYTLKLICYGDQIIADVGGTQLSTTDTHNNSATRHGFWGDSADIRFAFFKLRTL